MILEKSWAVAATTAEGAKALSDCVGPLVGSAKIVGGRRDSRRHHQTQVERADGRSMGCRCCRAGRVMLGSTGPAYGSAGGRASRILRSRAPRALTDCALQDWAWRMTCCQSRACFRVMGRVPALRCAVRGEVSVRHSSFRVVRVDTAHY